MLLIGTKMISLIRRMMMVMMMVLLVVLVVVMQMHPAFRYGKVVAGRRF